MLVWLVSIADTILAAIFTFIGFFVLIWTFTMAGILQDQDGKVLYCESSDNVEDVHQKILENNLPCVPVMDSNRVVSVIADYEFLTLIGKENISKARLVEGCQD